MAQTHGFSKKAAESIYGVHEGDTIRIVRLDDPLDHTYPSRVGVVRHIDSMGQLHGTWGGLAVIPGTDDFIIIKRRLDPPAPEEGIGGAPSPTRQENINK